MLEEGNMNNFWYSLHQGIEGKTQAKDFVNIPDFNPLNIELTVPSKMLLTLNIPDTWSSQPGDYNSLAIAVNNEIIVDGVYQSAIPNQRIPITISTVKEFSPGNYAIAAQWKNQQGGDLWIGATGTALLSAQIIVQK